MAIAPDAEWEIYCSRAEFDAARSDVRFQRIVTLARIVNSIRFVQIAVAEQRGRDSPSAARQRISSLLYLSGVLYEGLNFADRLGELFRSSMEFQSGIAAVLGDVTVKRLRANELEQLRNEAVYHHDDHVIETALRTMAADEYVFLSGMGRKRGDIYYELADLAVLQYALGSPDSTELFEKRVARLLTKITDVAIQFANASDTLIGAVLKELSWRRRPLLP